MYEEGDRVMLMGGRLGTEGTVTMVTTRGTWALVYVRWDNGIVGTYANDELKRLEKADG